MALQIRVLSPAAGPVRSAITHPGSGLTFAQTPGTLVDADPHVAEFLVANGWIRVGTVGPTASRPSSNMATSGIGYLTAQRDSEHVDTTLGAVVLFDGVNWRSVLTGAVV